MRPALTLLKITSLALCLAFSQNLAAADLTAVRVWPAYRTAASFERISEFIDGRENTSGQTILRSQPATRDGFYFLTRLKNSGPALENIRVELDILTPVSPEPRRITTFAATTIPAGSHVFQIGLTGTDWPDAQVQPVAWQLRLLNAEGRELLREQSFLWSQPAKN
jgi:hypothetical protein